MTPRRLIAATAAIITVLALQACLVTPLTAPLTVCLPAIFVAAVGLEAGASAGMSVGFSTGLLADLGSQHPAGVLALGWLLLGLGCGLVAGRLHSRGFWSGVVIVAVTAVAVGSLVAVALDLLAAPRAAYASVLSLVPLTAGADALLALLVVPAVRVVLRAPGVRATSMLRHPHIVTTAKLAADA